MVIFDFSETGDLDDSAAIVIGRLMDVAVESGTEVIVMGLGGTVEATLRSFNLLRSVPEERWVDNLDAAREIARALVNVDEAAEP